MEKISQHENRHQDIVIEQDNLRRCKFHQEVIEYALDRIDVAKADGRITVQDHAFLHEKYILNHIQYFSYPFISRYSRPCILEIARIELPTE